MFFVKVILTAVRFRYLCVAVVWWRYVMLVVLMVVLVVVEALVVLVLMVRLLSSQWTTISTLATSIQLTTTQALHCLFLL